MTATFGRAQANVTIWRPPRACITLLILSLAWLSCCSYGHSELVTLTVGFEVKIILDMLDIVSFFRMKKLDVLLIFTFVFLTLILFTSASPAARVRKTLKKFSSLLKSKKNAASSREKIEYLKA